MQTPTGGRLATVIFVGHNPRTRHGARRGMKRGVLDVDRLHGTTGSPTTWIAHDTKTQQLRTRMATDYDAPRKTDDELAEDSLEELKAQRANKSASAVDVDEVE